MHYFSALFGKEFYLFQTYLPSIIRSLGIVYTAIRICHTGYVACLLVRSGWKRCISLVFTIRIHHDARSSECQKYVIK